MLGRKESFSYNIKGTVRQLIKCKKILYLCVRSCENTWQHETSHRNHVQSQSKPWWHRWEANNNCSKYHQKYSPRSQNWWRKKEQLVSHIKSRYILVSLYNFSPVGQQIYDIRHCWWCPSPSLIVEFVESFRGKGQGITLCAIFNPIPLF